MVSCKNRNFSKISLAVIQFSTFFSSLIPYHLSYQYLAKFIARVNLKVYNIPDTDAEVANVASGN